MKAEIKTKYLLHKIIDRFFNKINIYLFTILFTSFIFISIHTSFHNNFDENHNSSCPVFVLEELYSALDSMSVEEISTLFIAFIFIAFKEQTYTFEAYSYFSIRAPPIF